MFFGSRIVVVVTVFLVVFFIGFLFLFGRPMETKEEPHSVCHEIRSDLSRFHHYRAAAIFPPKKSFLCFILSDMTRPSFISHKRPHARAGGRALCKGPFPRWLFGIFRLSVA